MVFTLLLIAVINSQLVITQKDFSTLEACREAGIALIEKQTSSPSFDRGIFAGCIENKKEKV